MPTPAHIILTEQMRQALSALDPADRLALLEALVDYAFTSREPEIQAPGARAVWLLLRDKAERLVRHPRRTRNETPAPAEVQSYCRQSGHDPVDDPTAADIIRRYVAPYPGADWRPCVDLFLRGRRPRRPSPPAAAYAADLHAP